MKNLYEKLFEEQIYRDSYNKIKSKPGSSNLGLLDINMTPGVDNETLDGISEDWITKTIKSLKDQTFKFKPSKRIYIPKKNGKMRPLGIPSPRDKIMQEAMKTILTTIYEPKFLDTSHGFRPNRSCHTALKEVKRNVGMVWVIEGDIKGYFDNIDHKILMNLISKEIKDQRFLDLIRKAIKAGYIYENIYHPNQKGVPQGSILSPILSNIYLHELDKYMSNLIQERSSKTPTTKDNPEYIKYHNLLQRSKKWEKEGKKSIQEIKAIRKEAKRKRMKLQSKIPIKGLTKIAYIRYCDDFIIGVTGEKIKAKEIKEEVKIFLEQKLKIELNETKTKITNIKYKKIKFLGTLIKQRASNNKHLIIRDNKGNIRRTSGNTIIMEAPIQELQKKLVEKGFFIRVDQRIIPVRYKQWVGLTTQDIILRYNSIALGIINYYSFAQNIPAIKKLIYLFKESLVKTLGDKLRLSTKKVYKRFGKNITTEDQTRSFVDINHIKKNIWDYKINFKEKDILEVTNYSLFHSWGTESECKICKSTLQVEMHHIKHLRKTNIALKGFAKQMSAINRKQIPVCRSCHMKIHTGEYDGIDLKKIIK